MAPDGKLLTLWTIRWAAGLYAVAVFSVLKGWDRAARLAWTGGCLLYLAHVVAAFQFYHGWSHRAAYEQTARQTAQLLGAGWGGGLYFNYVFTAIWIVDAIWWWRGIEKYRSRPGWATITVQTFFAFMFFNATVVFAGGAVRWLGAAATAILGLLALTARRRSRASYAGRTSLPR